MTDETMATNHVTPRFRDAFERRVPEIRAVPEGELLAITLDIPAAVATVLGAWPEIRKLRPEIERQLPAFDLAIFDRLESCALALGHAQTAYQTATEPPASLVELADEATKTRELLLAEVRTLILRELIDAKAIAELKGTTGYKNIAFDLFALSNVLKKNWAKVSSRTTIKTEELDGVEDLADRLLTAAGLREQAPTIAAEAVRDRQAAFTLFINTYDEVRAAIAYLRRKQGDVDSIAPSLYVGRNTSKRRAKDSESEDESDEADVASATAAPGASPVGATATSATSVKKPDVSAEGPFME